MTQASDPTTTAAAQEPIKVKMPPGAVTRPNRWSAGEVSFQTDSPCPRCGERMVLGYLFLTPDDGQHQHTHYVCVSWPRDRREACGWHGWTVPDPI